MSMPKTTQGLGRDPKYHGKFGIPDYIINTPQKPAQWWLVAFMALVIALPFGVWGTLEDRGTLATLGYALMAAVSILNAWFLRNDINETYSFLSFAMASGAFVIVGSLYTAIFESFPNEHWIAGLLLLSVVLLAVHNIYRAWQGMLVTGLFTEQQTPPDSPYYKPPA
jgi:hypothetical protein